MAMHRFQRFVHIARLLKNCAKAQIRIGRVAYGVVDQIDGSPNQVAEIDVQFDLVLLGVTKYANEAMRVLLEDLSRLRNNLAAADDKAVYLLDAFLATSEQEVLHGLQGIEPLIRFGVDCHAALDRLGKTIDVFGVTVVVAHEIFNPLEDIAFPVTQAIGDFGLHFEREEIGGALASEMQFVAGAQKKVIGFF